ncbi:sensor histidine kinase [Streptomyces albidoflavus]|uniref:Oxygen sensor histidine kinase NreB n=1 Tax=Streptomyces albidoflavus TaxID=1886 RepID=A0AA37FCS3_9ACTN|nr:sensor histidine kinase [Streptomyces albidoflavus]RZE55552.1 two-component sensor histidine kinase [Streptomyces albidoflavus]WQG72409.1 sensor histidine kinase [Streptomyces albidoflavus]GHI46937.1 two-component sensor histidine kinase [Streptomyces albidoflavus]
MRHPDDHPQPPSASPGSPASPASGAFAPGAQTRDDRLLSALLTTAFVVLLAGALLRYVLKHGDSDRLPWIVGLSVVLAVVQVAGQARPGSRRAGRVRLAVVVACWVVVVLLAPSFAWCAVPLIHTALRLLPTCSAVALVTALATLVVLAELRLADGFDPNHLLLPPVVAALATGVFVYLTREATRRQHLIDDLVRTRRELAATERREGTLAERQRLSREIHDSLAQGLSSQNMLLQAADRQWDTDPQAARTHLRTAASIAAHGLTEARRLVHDLAPADLAEGAGLAQALATLAARESRDGLTVRFHAEGPDTHLPDQAASALLRTAQGALANIREHSGARTAALTLTCLDDTVALDVADDGRGFPAPSPDAPRDPLGDPDPLRGHGLPAIRARLRQLGGTLAVESTPGEGAVLTATIPLTPATPPAP